MHKIMDYVCGVYVRCGGTATSSTLKPMWQTMSRRQISICVTIWSMTLPARYCIYVCMYVCMYVFMYVYALTVLYELKSIACISAIMRL